MQTYEILVRNRSVYANSADMTMVRTSIGIDEVHVLFDNEEWLGFPVTISFGHASKVVTKALSLTALSGSEWAAEATTVIPFEVTEDVGRVRVTLQGTDSEGRHIVTAVGAPLIVEEAGDVVNGVAPEDAPTADQWNQAYADAVSAANEARSVAASIGEQVDSIVSQAEATIGSRVESVLVPATRQSLGVVQVGDGLSVTSDGILSVIPVEAESSLTQEEASVLSNLQRLAVFAFDTEFDGGLLKDTVKVKDSALPTMPVADEDTAGIVRPDGYSVIVGDDGLLHSRAMSHEWNGPVLTITSDSGTSSSVDLTGPFVEIAGATASVDQTIGTPQVSVSVSGPDLSKTFDFAFSGLKGERGERGPSGYILTEEDIDMITGVLYERYVSGDETRY